MRNPFARPERSTPRAHSRRTPPKPSFRPTLEPLEDRVTPATLPTGFTETAVASGLSAATAMEFSPDGKLFVTEQAGTMEVWDNGSRLQANFFQNTPLAAYNAATDTGLVDSRGERGLLGVTFDPNFASNRFVYVYYTYAVNPDGNTGTATTFRNRVSRFTANASGDLALAGSEQVILELDNLSTAQNHNGGAIHFGPDGKLYIAVGDNANGSNAQSLATRHGKILRINPDGSIPTDNPFFNSTTGANRAIWAVGLRNPYTFSFQPGTGRMHINDVGEASWEEINVGAAGANYAWPSTEGDFSQATFPGGTPPFYAYSHGSGAFQGRAITGGAFYNPSDPGSTQFPSGFQGDYFFADYVNDWINVIDLNTRAVSQFATSAPGVVDLRVGDEGALYYLARDAGTVNQVLFTANAAPTITQQPQTQRANAGGSATFTVTATGSAPLTYQWQRAESGTSTWANISGATGASYTLTNVQASDANDQFRVIVTNSFGTQTSQAALVDFSGATGLPFTDAFNRAGGTNLGGDWTEILGELQIANDVLQGNAADSFAVVNGVSAADVTVQATVTNLDVGEYVGLVARHSGPGFTNFYQALLYNSSGVARAVLYRNVNGVWSPISTDNVVFIPQVGQTLRFEVVGNSQKLFLGNTLLAYANDTALSAAGSVGVRVLGQASLDNFSAATATTANGALGTTYTFGTTPTGQLDNIWREVAGNFLVNGTATGNAPDSMAVLNGIAEADVAVQATVTNLDVGEYVGLVARHSGQGFTNFYVGLLYNSSGIARAVLYRNVNGVWSAISSDNVVRIPQVGQTLRFEVVGSSQRLLLGDTVVASANDTAITAAGSVGMRVLGQASLDDFRADEMARPTLPFSEDWEGDAVGSPLGTEWVPKAGTFAVVNSGVAGNEAVAGTGADAYAVVNLDPTLYRDVAIQAVVSSLVGSGQYLALTARDTGTGYGNFYQAFLYNSGGTARAAIYRVVNGNVGLISADVLVDANAANLTGDTVRFEVFGSTQRLLVNGVLVASASDTFLSNTGSVGMRSGAGASWDSFNALQLVV